MWRNKIRSLVIIWFIFVPLHAHTKHTSLFVHYIHPHGLVPAMPTSPRSVCPSDDQHFYTTQHNAIHTSVQYDTPSWSVATLSRHPVTLVSLTPRLPIKLVKLTRFCRICVLLIDVESASLPFESACRANPFRPKTVPRQNHFWETRSMLCHCNERTFVIDGFHQINIFDSNFLQLVFSKHVYLEIQCKKPH